MSNHTFETTITTIQNIEHDVTVNFDYSPKEEQYFNADVGIGSPCFAEEIHFNSVIAPPAQIDFVITSETLSKNEWILLEEQAFGVMS